MNLSVKTQLRLAQLISIIAEGEKRTEMVRQVLAEQRLFEPYTAFKRLDQTRTGELVITDIIDFLRDNKVIINSKEADYLFRRIDINRDGRITYPEYSVQFINSFVKAILPREDTRLRQLASLRESYYLEKNMLLPHEVEWALTRVFEQEIVNYRQISVSQEFLTSSYDFNSLDAFRTIDDPYLGYVTIESLKDFMERCGVLLSYDELMAFFRVVDQDEDGRITYSELLEAITFVPNYFNLSSEINQMRRSRQMEKDLRRSQEKIEQLRYSRELQQEQLRSQLNLSRSQERLEEIRRNREEVDRLDYLRRSRERIEQLDEMRRSREYEDLKRSRELLELTELERSKQTYQQLRRSQERLDDLRKSRQQYEQMQRSRDLIAGRDRFEDDLRRSRDRVEDIRNSRERYEQISHLRKSRERLEDMRKSQERIDMMKRSRDRELEAQRTRDQVDFLQELRNSRERIQDMNQLRRSRDQVQNLRRSQERQNDLEELRRSRERMDAIEELRLSRLRQEELRMSRENLDQLDRLQKLDRQRELERLNLDAEVEKRRSQERLRDLERRIEQRRIESELLTQSKLVQSRIYESQSPKKPFRY